MEENMTDKQFEKIVQMISMILDGCKDLDEAKKKIAELRDGKDENEIKKSQQHPLYKIKKQRQTPDYSQKTAHFPAISIAIQG